MRQQRAVVGDDQGRSASVGEQRRQQRPSVLVEVVARFVEDQPGVTDQCRSGQSDACGLSAGEAAQTPVEIADAQMQTEFGQRRQGSLFDIPIVADEVEVGPGRLSGQGAAQRLSDGGDVQRGIDPLRRMRQQLVDVDGAIGTRDGS